MIKSVEETTELLIAEVGAYKATKILASLTPYIALGRDFFNDADIYDALDKFKSDPNCTFNPRSPGKIDVLTEIRRQAESQTVK